MTRECFCKIHTFGDFGNYDLTASTWQITGFKTALVNRLFALYAINGKVSEHNLSSAGWITDNENKLGLMAHLAQVHESAS